MKKNARATALAASALILFLGSAAAIAEEASRKRPLTVVTLGDLDISIW